MLASAVQKRKDEQREAQSGAQKTLAQQLFSSSPVAQDRPHSPASGFERSTSNVGGQALKPSSSLMWNGGRQASQKAFVNPLKRSISSLSSSTTLSNNSDPKRSFSAQSKQQAAPAVSSKQGSGLLSQLHQQSFFDENDYLDDPNFDLDALEPINTKPDKVTYPTLPEVQAKYPESSAASTAPSPVSREHQSSVPYAWSSSPLSHMQPANPSLLGRPTSGATLQQQPGKVGSAEAVDVDVDEFERPRLSKRSRLPWAGNEEEPEMQQFTGSKRQQRPKKEKADIEASTPAANKMDAYLFNQTASAVKAEQKKLRQQNKAPSAGKINFGSLGDETADISQKPLAKSSTKRLAEVFLSEEQQRVLDLVLEQKKSVFFTGSAGTGKSVLMREIIAQLRKRYARETDRIAVTASTGLAACNIGGNTLHSFAGIGLGKETVDQLVKKIKRNQKSLARWQRTKVLIIDEISMIDGALFDKLEQIARTLRRKMQPFGGIQLVVTGDFFQLPPIGDQAKFSFDAATWNTCIDYTIGLTHVFRQKDPMFAGMLNDMRVGKVTPELVRMFQSLSRPLKSKQDDMSEATELFSTREEVERANTARMQRLAGTCFEFAAVDGGSITNIDSRTQMLSNCMAPRTISLKKGSQVMLIKNIDETLVNGSIGKVVAFMDEKMFDYYDDHEEEFQSTAPTLDANSFSEEGDRKNMKQYMYQANRQQKQQQAAQAPGNTAKCWPVVRFQTPDGTTRDLLCQPESWKIEQPNGEVLASRTQVPLILAWALSIHKAQGQTLEKVKVDLGRVFEKGQAYVALSRATTQEGLQVLRFNADKVRAHDRVKRFYESLYGVETIASVATAKKSLAAATAAKTAAATAGGRGFNGGRAPTDLLAAMDSGFSVDEEEALAQLAS